MEDCHWTNQLGIMVEQVQSHTSQDPKRLPTEFHKTGQNSRRIKGPSCHCNNGLDLVKPKHYTSARMPGTRAGLLLDNVQPGRRNRLKFKPERVFTQHVKPAVLREHAQTIARKS